MENYNQKLETLLSKFGEIINDKCATGPYLPLEYDKYFCCAYKNIKDLNVDIESINLLTSNPRLYEMIDNPIKNQRAGLLLSALIDKAVKKGEKIQIKTLMPINCLFYKLENLEAHVNMAGDDLGSRAKNSKIFADKTGHSAGSYMDNCELQVNIAGDYLGHGAKNSKIYAAYEAGNNAGKKMKNSQLFIDKLDGKLKGNLRIKNRIYLGKESYEHHPVIYRLTRVKILEK